MTAANTRTQPDPHPLIAPGSSTETPPLQQPVARFQSFYDARVKSEQVFDLAGLYTHVIAQPLRQYRKKEYVPCFSLAEFKVAPYIGRTADKYGPIPGKQRSNSHIVKMGPGVAFDVDSVPMQEISNRLKALGLAHIVFSSYSSGEEDPAENKVKGRGRVLLFLNDTWLPHEHGSICHTINEHVLGGVADTNAFAAPQPFAVHAIKTADQPTFHFAQYGYRLSLQKIKTIMPSAKQGGSGSSKATASADPDALIIEEAREIGALGCVDDEKPWFAMINSIRRTWPHPTDPKEVSTSALDVADAMSAAAKGYVNRADVADKMKRTDGEKYTTKFDFVQTFAEKCAVAIIEGVHGQTTDNVVKLTLKSGTPSKVFAGADLPTTRLGEEIAPGMELPKSLPLTPDNAMRAALYLARWRPPHVIDGLLQRYPALGQHRPEIDAAKARYAAQQEQRRGDTERGIVAEFNDKYAVVSDEGDTVIYHQRPSPLHWQSAHVPMKFEDLKKLCQNRRVNVGTDNKPHWRTAADVWLDHPDRTTYSGGLVYAPPGIVAPPDALNLWRGFAVKPAPGAWKRMEEHIFENICKGDGGNFGYLLNKLAYGVQNAGLPGEVATVMRGGSGAGKGIVARELAYLYGPHALQIADRRHLVGNFNEHLVGRSLVVADEAFYPGDKPSVSVLKSLLTEKLFMFEGKFKTAKQMPNTITLVMPSNEEWVVPAEMDTRRFFVLDVSDKRVNDHAYFEAIDAEMRSGGHAAMLHDLLHRDLTKFNVRAVPQTEALLVQKLHSLTPHAGWWHECLTQGYVYRSQHRLEKVFEQWQPFVAMDLLYASYTAYCGGERSRRMSRTLLGSFLQGFGSPARPATAMVGEIPNGMFHGAVGRPKEKDRPHGYDFGDLATARARFTAVTKMLIDPGLP